MQYYQGFTIDYQHLGSQANNGGHVAAIYSERGYRAILSREGQGGRVGGFPVQRDTCAYPCLARRRHIAYGVTVMPTLASIVFIV